MVEAGEYRNLSRAVIARIKEREGGTIIAIVMSEIIIYMNETMEMVPMVVEGYRRIRVVPFMDDAEPL